jgi:hypothetical protein
MSMTRPIGGVADVNYNGNVLLFRGEMTWSFQVFAKKGIAGRDGRVHGFTADPMVPYIEGTFTYDGSFTIADLEKITGATVSVELGDGRQLVLREAYVAGEITAEGDEGKMKIKFEGQAGEELAAQS